MEVIQYNFKCHEDSRGALVITEGLKEIPFDIKRVYYMYNIPKGEVRGKHAHKETKQVLVCLSGSCIFTLDDGTEKKEICLNDPKKGLLVDNLVWHDMYDFAPNTILMAYASSYYSEEDYIRDYDDFLEYIK